MLLRLPAVVVRAPAVLGRQSPAIERAPAVLVAAPADVARTPPLLGPTPAAVLRMPAALLRQLPAARLVAVLLRGDCCLEGLCGRWRHEKVGTCRSCVV
jgi:hypothetical protein